MFLLPFDTERKFFGPVILVLEPIKMQSHFQHFEDLWKSNITEFGKGNNNGFKQKQAYYDKSDESELMKKYGAI